MITCSILIEPPINASPLVCITGRDSPVINDSSKLLLFDTNVPSIANVSPGDTCI